MEDWGALPAARKLSSKVVAVAAGEVHTLALTGGGCVYAWGRGTFGRLGTGADRDEHFPVRIKVGSGEREVKFVGVAAGSYHSLALADDGSVWSWGHNIYGQLGFNGENTYKPCLLEQFLELGSTYESEAERKGPLKICQVKAGGMMSLAIDNLGTLWIWGRCPLASDGYEESFCLTSSFTPAPVWDFVGHTVVKVACGNEHILALVSAGETYDGKNLICFSWGSNSHGQLGLGDEESRLRPQIVRTFSDDSPWAAYQIACGASHSAVLTHRKRPFIRSEESVCWTFGLGENGQLGHGTAQNESSPKHVKGLPTNAYLVSIDCGLFHTSVVSLAGEVWSWGMEKGLGLCRDPSSSRTESDDALSPVRISSNGESASGFEDPVQIACGAAHTVLLALDGYKLWSWGRGRSGVLGNGKTTDCLAPTIALWPPLTEDFEGQEPSTNAEEELAEKDYYGVTDERTDVEEEEIVEKDFETELSTDVDEEQLAKKDSEGAIEIERKQSVAMKEMRQEMTYLQERLCFMEQYANILHGSIFGKPLEERDIPELLQKMSNFDIASEWETMIESADDAELLRLENLYKNMLSGVKAKLRKKRVHELMHEFLHFSPSGGKS